MTIFLKLSALSTSVNKMGEEKSQLHEDALPLLRELCHIAAHRNEINLRRHRARFRKSYYSKAIACLEAHNKSNKQSRALEAKLLYLESAGYSAHGAQKLELKKKLDDIYKRMAYTVSKSGPATKWKAMGIMKLRSLALQGEGEYALAKHETMEYSIKTTDRVKELLELVKGRLVYDNGSILSIYINVGQYPNYCLGTEEIEKFATEYKLNQAITSMLEEPDVTLNQD